MPKNPLPPPPDHQRCTAQSKRRGERCNAYRVTGKTVCKMHGGLSTGPKGGLKLYRSALTPEEQALFDDPDALSPAEIQRAIAARLHTCLQAGPAGADAFDRYAGRYAQMGNLALAQQAAAAAVPDASQQLIVAPPVAKSAAEWADGYKPDVD